MASPGASRAEKSARRLTEITDASAKVFARRGYHGASTQDIADVLGMRQASLYYYFQSKEAALEAVCVSGLEDYAKRALAISKSDVTSSEKVAALVFQHLAPLAERLDYTVVFLRERRFLPQPARKRIRAIEVRYERLIQRIIEQGIAGGEFRSGSRRPHGGPRAARPGQFGRALVRARAGHHRRTRRAQLHRSAGARLPATPLKSVLHLLAERARSDGQGIAYRAKRLGLYRRHAGTSTPRDVARCAAGLQRLGLKRGERVAIMGDACEEWMHRRSRRPGARRRHLRHLSDRLRGRGRISAARRRRFVLRGRGPGVRR